MRASVHHTSLSNGPQSASKEKLYYVCCVVQITFFSLLIGRHLTAPFIAAIDGYSGEFTTTVHLIFFIFAVRKLTHCYTLFPIDQIQEYIKYKICSEFIDQSGNGDLLFSFHFYESDIKSNPVIKETMELVLPEYSGFTNDEQADFF